jgi:hypothetical protein
MDFSLIKHGGFMRLKILLLVSFMFLVSCSSNQIVTNDNTFNQNQTYKNQIGHNGKVYNNSRF